MSCEKQGGPYERLSLVDGSIEQVHFKPAEEILASISQLPKVKPKSIGSGAKRPFVPIGCPEDLLGR